MRIFFATDIHGSEICFEKFLKARVFYEADILLLGGDIYSGSAIFADEVGDHWRVRFNNREILLRSPSELDRFRSMLANRGQLLKVLAPGEQRSDDELNDQFDAQLLRWVELASRISDQPIYYVPGNDDPIRADKLLVEPFINVHGRHVELNERVSILGVGGSTETPWHTEREYSEQQLKELISAAYDDDLKGRSLVLLSHCPPYGSGLDSAPSLLPDFSYELHLGAPRFAPVGSHAVRDAVGRYAPILGLFGHIHEARRYTKIHDTLCINPGSIFWTGRLQGCIVDILDGNVARFQLTEG